MHLKDNIFTGNHKPHACKTLRLAIMERSRLKSKANKTRLSNNLENYKKQRNLVIKLNKQLKKRIFQ